MRAEAQQSHLGTSYLSDCVRWFEFRGPCRSQDACTVRRGTCHTTCVLRVRLRCVVNVCVGGISLSTRSCWRWSRAATEHCAACVHLFFVLAHPYGVQCNSRPVRSWPQRHLSSHAVIGCGAYHNIFVVSSLISVRRLMSTGSECLLIEVLPSSYLRVDVLVCVGLFIFVLPLRRGPVVIK